MVWASEYFSPLFLQPTAANSAESLDSIPHSDCESIQPELEEVKPEVGQLDTSVDLVFFIYFIYLVFLTFLIYLVFFIYLIYLVFLSYLTSLCANLI